MKRSLMVIVSFALLAACAQIPDGGAVHKVQSPASDTGSAVRYAPAGPVRDATPNQIVSGFLDAMLAYPVTTTVASSFLSPDGARSWKSSAGVRIYSEPTIDSAPGGLGSSKSASVQVSLHTEATLDVQGRYSATGDGDDYVLNLSQVKGQWRIDNPPAGFLINQKFFDDYYRPFSLYFFDRSGKRLVPVPIYLPIGEQLTTSMMTSLLRGPSGVLADTARSYIPAGAKLSTSAPVERDGVVDVQFKDDLIALPVSAKERLSAQIVWTLRQADGVSGVRIIGADTEVNPQGSGAQPVDSWSEFGPPTSPGTFFAIRADTIVRMSGRSVAAVSGQWGKDAKDAAAVAVNRSEERLAVVSADRRVLRLGSLSRDEKPIAATYGGQGIVAPLFDDRDQLWVFDRADGATRLRLFDATDGRRLDLGRLARMSVDSFALAPGGSRYALIGKGRSGAGVYVGAVLTDAKDNVTGLGPPRRLDRFDADLTGVRSITWSDTGALTFLAARGSAGDQVFGIRIDGSVPGGSAARGPLLPDVNAVRVALAGGAADIGYVADKDRRMWWHAGNGLWELLDEKRLSAPFYTG